MNELPLILFGVLSQAAVGLALVLALLPLVLRDRAADLAGATRLAGRLVFPFAVLAVLASFFHLGDPLGGFRALSHVGGSWMSNEVVLAAVFTAVSAVLFFLHQWQPASAGAIRAATWVTALVGLVLVFATGMIYQLPTRPEWYHWSNLLAGYVTALLLGALLMALLALWKAEAPASAARLLGAVALAGAGLLAVSLIFYAPYLTGVSAVTAEAVFGNLLFWARLAVGIGLPVYAAAQMTRGQQPGRAVLSLALVAAFAGEIVARGIFYTSVLDQVPFF
jgi:anaerobic dimethyl sulfoxide reductase subunit C